METMVQFENDVLECLLRMSLVRISNTMDSISSPHESFLESLAVTIS